MRRGLSRSKPVERAAGATIGDPRIDIAIAQMRIPWCVAKVETKFGTAGLDRIEIFAAAKAAGGADEADAGEDAGAARDSDPFSLPDRL